MKYKRILLKLSGEALMGNQQYGISSEILQSYSKQIKEISEMGVEIAIVIGGGNIFRGVAGVATVLTGFKATIWECLPRLLTEWLYKVLWRQWEYIPDCKLP